MDNAEFKFLRDWAEDVAWDIFEDIYESHEMSSYPVNMPRLQSIILESMSPAKGWKNGINKN